MPETVADLGRKVKAKYPGSYDDLDDAEVGRKVKAKFHGAYDDFSDEPRGIAQSGPIKQGPRTWAQRMGVAEKWQEPILDVLEGAASGVAKTAYGIGDIQDRLLGGERVIETPAARRQMTAPPSLAGQVGQGIEQGAEYLIPSSRVAKGAKLIQGATVGLQPAARAVLNTAGRAGLEAVGAGLVAGAQTGGDPRAMGQAALTAGGVTAALPVVGKVAGAVVPRLEQSALTQYQRVLNPTKQGTKYLSKTQTAPGLIERRVTAATLPRLQAKIATQVQGYGQAIADAWDNVPAGTSIDLSAITKGLDDAAQEFTITTSRGAVPKGEIAEQAIARYGSLKKTLESIAEQNPITGVMEVPVDRLRELRQFFDTMAAKAGRYEGKSLAEQSLLEAQGRVADTIREEFAKKFPNIATINKEFNFWSNAQKVVDETMLRRTGQAIPLGRKLAAQAFTGAGAVVGYSGGPAISGIGSIVGRKLGSMMEEALSSPAWGTVSAVWKDKLAKAIAKGSKPEVEFWLRKMGIGMGGAAATRSKEE